MSNWEQFALYQAIGVLHTLIRKYGAKYLTPAELAAGDTLADALGDLPQRIHDGGLTPATGGK